MSQSQQSYQNSKTLLSWVQLPDGEWSYFTDNNNYELTTLDADYIWFACQESHSHAIGGYRVANHCIESTLKELAAIEDVVVFGAPNEKKGNLLQVYVTLSKEGSGVTNLSDVISAKLIGKFGSFLTPENIHLLEKIPAYKNKSTCRKILKSRKLTMSYVA